MAGTIAAYQNIRACHKITCNRSNYSLSGVFKFKVIKFGVNHLDIELSGILDAEEMKIAESKRVRGGFYPCLNIRAFNRSQKTEAEVWLLN